ncbi:DUF4268 domain-containing protein, partial [Mesorhizobium sp. ZMM04-5]
TVLWLMNFNIRLQCFKATPYAMNDELFLTVEQIIPTRDAEEFMIGLASKAQDEVVGAEAQIVRHALRREFWAQFLAEMNRRSELFQNITTSQTNWLMTGSGTKGIGLKFTVTKDACKAEIYIDRDNEAENRRVFDALSERKVEIEKDFGGPLIWEEVEGRRAYKIMAKMPGNIFDKSKWPNMTQAMVGAMVRLEPAFRKQAAAVQMALAEPL